MRDPLRQDGSLTRPEAGVARTAKHHVQTGHEEHGPLEVEFEARPHMLRQRVLQRQDHAGTLEAMAQ